MSDSDNQLPNSDRPVVSGRLRVEPWDARSSCQPQLKLFCGPDAFQFVSPSSHPEPPRAQTRNNRSDNSSCMNDFVRDLLSFCESGKKTQVAEILAATFGGEPLCIPTYANEFWPRNQRDNHSLHAISYRPWFNPQLPRFFIQRLTQPGDVVYDPFQGRGTTLLEAGLLGRVPYGNDVDPLSVLFCCPRFSPPKQDEVARRLAEIDFANTDQTPEDLLVFYHPDTLREICALRQHLSRQLDSIDQWIRMVALNRLVGHAPGYFSVCSVAPNQTVSVQQQMELNEKRCQIPIRKHVTAIIARKTAALLSDCDDTTRRVLAEAGARARWLTGPASATRQLPSTASPWNGGLRRRELVTLLVCRHRSPLREHDGCEQIGGLAASDGRGIRGAASGFAARRLCRS